MVFQSQSQHFNEWDTSSNSNNHIKTQPNFERRINYKIIMKWRRQPLSENCRQPSHQEEFRWIFSTLFSATFEQWKWFLCIWNFATPFCDSWTINYRNMLQLKNYYFTFKPHSQFTNRNEIIIPQAFFFFF